MRKSFGIILLIVLIVYMVLIADITRKVERESLSDQFNLECKISSQNEIIERKTIELEMLNELLDKNRQVMNTKFWFVIKNKELFKIEH